MAGLEGTVLKGQAMEGQVVKGQVVEGRVLKGQIVEGKMSGIKTKEKLDTGKTSRPAMTIVIKKRTELFIFCRTVGNSC